MEHGFRITHEDEYKFYMKRDAPLATSGIAIDHVQIAAPTSCEAAARRFYGDVLGLPELEKPASLQARGGCWFACGSHQVHIGVDPDFRAARKAHVAFSASDLNGLRARLASQGFRTADDDTLPGRRRFYCDDPWGNRLEFVETTSPPVLEDRR